MKTTDEYKIIFICDTSFRTNNIQLYAVKSGWSQITTKLMQNIYSKIVYSWITSILEGIKSKKIRKFTNFGPKLPCIESGFSKNQDGFQKLKFKTYLQPPLTFYCSYFKNLVLRVKNAIFIKKFVSYNFVWKNQFYSAIFDDF